jgi:hypothetical protein
MLDNIRIFLIDRYLNPCKKCLVRATCQQSELICPDYKRYNCRKNALSLIQTDIEWWIIGTLLIISLLFITATFAFGIWSWIELIF